MARSLNRVMLIGNLGADPEVRYDPSGQAKVSFSLATSYSVKRNEEWEEKTEWHKVVQWGPKAEKTAEFYRKGHKVFVDGRNQTREYDKDGQRHSITEVIANDVIGMEPRASAPEGTFEGAPAQQAAPARQPVAAGYDTSELDDLPF